MEDYFSFNFRLMAYVLDEVATQKEPITDQMVATRFPYLKDAGKWSASIGIELRALTEGESLRTIRQYRGGGSPLSGFECWRLLRQRWDPETTNKAFIIHQRTLAFPEAPSIEKLGDSIARLRELMNEYDSRSHVAFSDDMRKAAILRTVPSALREHFKDMGYEGSQYPSAFALSRIDERIKRKAEDKETKNLNALGATAKAAPAGLLL